MTYTIENRLAQLPAKTAMPFRQLLSAGQIPEDVIHTVLDAGEITGDIPKLIGFAVGFLHLRAQGVPVHDVIRMAKAQKRRINLSWGAKRWKEEHDRLSRAEALQRMAADNVRYDVSKYEKHLPERFCGYLSEAFEMASLDYDLIEWEFDDFLEEFGRILHRISSKGQYFVEGENMGWRHLSGWAIVEAEDARAFMSRAFPKTSEWTLRGQFDRRRRILTYTLSHHDAPTGEYYTVRACRAEDRRRQ